MNGPLFKVVHYALGSLISGIGLGMRFDEFLTARQPLIGRTIVDGTTKSYWGGVT